MYKLMAYTDEWISLYERWDDAHYHTLYAVNFSEEGWQGGVVVRHVLLQTDEGRGQRDRFIVLICDGVDSLNLIESILLRTCRAYLDALLVPSAAVDEATAIYGIQQECRKIDRLLPGMTASREAKKGPWRSVTARYSAVAVVILVLTVGPYVHINRQVAELSDKSRGLNARVDDLLDDVSGGNSRQGLSRRLKAVETAVGKVRSDHADFLNQVALLRKRSSTRMWQLSCWDESDKACYIYADAKPPRNEGNPRFRSFGYQLRVSRHGDAVAMELVHFAGEHQGWDWAMLRFDDKDDKTFFVGLEDVGLGKYRVAIGGSGEEGGGTGLSVEQVVQEMIKGAKLSVTTGSAQGNIAGGRMAFTLLQFRDSYNKLRGGRD